MSVAITVENLSKKYIIGHQPRERYTALRDVLANGAKRFAQKLAHPFAQPEDDATHETFWALKDVNFTIKEGDRVGIIGRNGAGKSTLLKILSRITEPTSGRIKIRGRVSSLLEVGTGFHPELTGRENIYLNGAVLGMGKAEITRKFDEIIAFAEVERFLDTPVKHYSSGMYMRLAFAVAAHLESEILLLDEVLAVGDAHFQKKCMGKVDSIGKQGRTVLFVSHNMNAVEDLCASAMLLKNGQVGKFSSDIRSVIKDYLLWDGNDVVMSRWSNERNQYSSPYFTPRRMAITDQAGNNVVMPARNDAEIWIQIDGSIERSDIGLQVGYAIYSEEGSLMYWTCQADMPEGRWTELRPGEWSFRSRLPKRLFNEGKYRLELLAALYCREWLTEPGVRAPSIYLDIQGGLSDSPYWLVRRPGLLAPVVEWNIEPR